MQPTRVTSKVSVWVMDILDGGDTNMNTTLRLNDLLARDKLGSFAFAHFLDGNIVRLFEVRIYTRWVRQEEDLH